MATYALPEAAERGQSASSTYLLRFIIGQSFRYLTGALNEQACHWIGGAVPQCEDSHRPRLYCQIDRQNFERQALRTEVQDIAGEDGKKAPGREQRDLEMDGKCSDRHPRKVEAVGTKKFGD